MFQELLKLFQIVSTKAFVHERFLRSTETGSGTMSDFNVMMNTAIMPDETVSYSELCSSTTEI